MRRADWSAATRERDAPSGRAPGLIGRSDIIGREAEIARIETFLGAAERPLALVLDGAAGIGKTTLWTAGVEMARTHGYRVLACQPAGTEVSLAYGALADLITPVLDEVLPVLPAPQRWALEVALFLREPNGPSPDVRAIGVALLGVLDRLARSSPLLIAIDESQWVDPASAVVTEYALRRLERPSIRVLAAVRSNLARAGHLQLGRTLTPEGVERLAVGPLSLGALQRLMRARLGVALPRPTLIRIHEASAGNPFFALELGRTLRERDWPPHAGQHLVLPESLQDLLDARLARNPRSLRSLLATVAAMSDPTVATVAAVTGSSTPDVRSSLATASLASVVEVDVDDVRFMHPLLASSAYWGVGSEERRDIHRRLAATAANLEERARHLALAVGGPDESIALVLDAAARQAAGRGAMVTAAELADLAVAATPGTNPADGQRRRLQLAERSIEVGDWARARGIIEELLPELEPGPTRADALLLLSQVHGSDIDAQTRLCRAALHDAGDDPPRLVRIHRRLAETAAIGMDQRTALEHARSAVLAAERVGDARLLASSLAYVALFETFLGSITPDLLEHAIELEERAGYLPEYESPSMVMGYRLLLLDQFDEARDWLERADRRARAHDDFASQLTIALHLAELDIGAGRWLAAIEHAAEGFALADELDSDHARSALLYVRARAEALLGHLDAARGDAATGLTLAQSSGSQIYQFHNRRVLGLVALAIEDYATATAWLEPLLDLEGVRARRVGYHAVLPEVVEAFIGLGRLDRAAELLAMLEEAVRSVHRPRLAAAAARCRGIWLAGRDDFDAAIEVLRAAANAEDHQPGAFERGRTLLALGRVERRASRRRDARRSLQEALGIFEDLGAVTWREQARLELARIGGRRASTGALTATEEQVAALVAEGRTNREAAEALFLSVHTIEGHLSRIYSKLDVRSRAELAHLWSTHSPSAARRMDRSPWPGSGS